MQPGATYTFTMNLTSGPGRPHQRRMDASSHRRDRVRLGALGGRHAPRHSTVSPDGTLLVESRAGGSCNSSGSSTRCGRRSARRAPVPSSWPWPRPVSAPCPMPSPISWRPRRRRCGPQGRGACDSARPAHDHAPPADAGAVVDRLESHDGPCPRGMAEVGPAAHQWPNSLMTRSSSIGSGKMIVEFFSAEISVSVCR